MRRVLISSLSVLALAACGPETPAQAEAPPTADAAAKTPVALPLGGDGLPRFRPGLWEATQVEDGETETSHRCVGPETDAELREMLTRESPDCTTKRSASAGGLRVTSVCTPAGMPKMESTLTMTGSESAYDMKLALYVINADGSREGGETTVKAKWVGACPPGVEPGEDIEP
jgi:hypothetical protein